MRVNSGFVQVGMKYSANYNSFEVRESLSFIFNENEDALQGLRGVRNALVIECRDAFKESKKLDGMNEFKADLEVPENVQAVLEGSGVIETRIVATTEALVEVVEDNVFEIETE